MCAAVSGCVLLIVGSLQKPLQSLFIEGHRRRRLKRCCT
jgi:hypothetical protein